MVKCKLSTLSTTYGHYKGHSIYMSDRIMASKKVKIKIFGRVQGVFFRVSAMEKCREYNVSCEPVNMPDGTVEIAAQGEENDISSFIEWCKKGPIFANVDKVEVVHETD